MPGGKKGIDQCTDKKELRDAESLEKLQQQRADETGHNIKIW
jgi:hypothetical protein